MVPRLLQDGHRVRVMRREWSPASANFELSRDVDWVSGDFHCPSDVARALSGADCVIHLVSNTTPKSSNDDSVGDVQENLISTLHMLESMRALGVKKIVFASSGGTVYGRPTYLPIDENHPTNPLVSYGIVKLAIEKYLLLHKNLYELQPIILRISNPFGEGQRLNSAQGAVGIFLDMAIRGDSIDIWGDGGIVRDYIYVGDVAEAFSCAVQYRGSQTTFNVSTGEGTSLNDLLILIEGALGREVRRRYLPGRMFDVAESVLCNSRIRDGMGWTPRTSIRDGIERTRQWIEIERAGRQ